MGAGDQAERANVRHPLREWVLVIVIVGVLVLMLWPGPPGREEPRRIRCRNNLNQLAKGMATYLNECGDNRFYPWPTGYPGCGPRAWPRFGGAEWLATLYWTKIIPDPGVFNCPSSPDCNEMGTELGTWGTPGGRPLSADAVSYAGMGFRSVGIYLCSKQGKGAAYARSILALQR
jgi:hypothetical protein